MKSISYEYKKPYYLRADYKIALPSSVERPNGELIYLYTIDHPDEISTDDGLITIIQTDETEKDEFPYGAINYLNIKRYYASDGMSVPLIFIPLIAPWVSRRKRVIPGFVHDALYELMRKEKLSRENRLYADVLLYNLCVECGAPKWIAKMFYLAVRRFGKKYTLGSERRQILYAP